MTKSNDTLIDAITEAVTRRQTSKRPIPVLLVEGYCFLGDNPLPMGDPLAKLLEETVPENKTYETSKSTVTWYEPDLHPLTDDLGGPRYLFSRKEVAG